MGFSCLVARAVGTPIPHVSPAFEIKCRIPGVSCWAEGLNLQLADTKIASTQLALPKAQL